MIIFEIHEYFISLDNFELFQILYHYFEFVFLQSNYFNCIFSAPFWCRNYQISKLERDIRNFVNLALCYFYTKTLKNVKRKKEKKGKRKERKSEKKEEEKLKGEERKERKIMKEWKKDEEEEKRENKN